MCCCCCKIVKKCESVHAEPEVVVVKPVEAIILQPNIVESEEGLEIPEIKVIAPLTAEVHGFGITYIAEDSSPLFKKWVNTMYVIDSKKVKELYNGSKEARENEAHRKSIKPNHQAAAAKRAQQKALLKAKELYSSQSHESFESLRQSVKSASKPSKKSIKPFGRDKAISGDESFTEHDPIRNSNKRNSDEVSDNTDTTELTEKQVLLNSGNKSSIMALEKQNNVMILVSEAFNIAHPVCTVRAIQVVGDNVENVIKAGHTVESLLPLKDTVTYTLTQVNADYEQDLLNKYASSKACASKYIDDRKKSALNTLIGDNALKNSYYEVEMAKDFPMGTYELNPTSSCDPRWATIIYVEEDDYAKRMFLVANDAEKMAKTNCNELEDWCKSKRLENGLKIIDSFKRLSNHQEVNSVNLRDIEREFNAKSSVSDVFLSSFDKPMRAIKFIGYTKESVIEAENAFLKNYGEHKCKVNKSIICLATSSNSIFESKQISDRILKGISKSYGHTLGKGSHMMYVLYPFNYDKYFGPDTQCRIVQSLQQKTNTMVICSRLPLVHKGVLKHLIEVDGTNDDVIFGCIKYLADAADVFKQATTDWHNPSDLKAYNDYITRLSNLSDEPTVQVLGKVPLGFSGDVETLPARCLVAVFAIPKLKIDRGPFFDRRDSQLVPILNRFNCVAKFTGMIEEHEIIVHKGLSAHATWYRIHIIGLNLKMTKKCINSVIAIFSDWILIKFTQQI